MIVAVTGEEPPTHIVLLFGAGLIGAAILRALGGRLDMELNAEPFAWNDPRRQAADRHALFLAVCSLAGSAASDGRPGPNVHTVWSAGRGGFASSEESLRCELDSFESVLQFASDLADSLPDSRHSFHLVSSAGGLFEGQVDVGAASQPCARRPYGELKLRQERLLGAISARLRAFVYRPSSVYGVAGAGARSGLVPTLLRNALKGALTSIYGDPSTLRDYVTADDVGRFIAEKVISPVALPGAFLLACGKPTALFEVCRTVESVVDRPLYVAYDSTCDNAAHTTFRFSALPEDWWPMDVYTGIRVAHARVAAQLSRCGKE